MDFVKNALAIRESAFDQGAKFRQTMGQNMAGNALAAGDTRGAANALFSTGQLDAGETVQRRQEDRQSRATARQFETEDRALQTIDRGFAMEDREQAQAAQQQEMRLEAMTRAATFLQRVPPGQRAQVLQNQVIPMFGQIGIDTKVFGNLTENDLSDQGLMLFDQQLEQERAKLVTLSQGQQLFSVKPDGSVEQVASVAPRPQGRATVVIGGGGFDPDAIEWD